MPELSVRRRRASILLPVAVLRPGTFSDLETFSATALLDTGASVSGIGPRVINGLGLKSYAKNRLGVATEERFVDYYLSRLGLFSDNQAASEQLGPGDLPYIFDELDGFSWTRAADFDVILGMDVLSQCDLLLDRHGRCTIRFGQ